MNLRGLIEAVEAGTLDLALMEDHLPTANDSAKAWDNFIAAFNGSLDAAKRLHDALLPGWKWMAGTSVVDGRKTLVSVWKEAVADKDWKVSVGSDDVAARAFLLAILRAMEGR